MAAIAFNPTLALPARVTLAKVRARSVAVRASARPAGSRAASKIDTESQSLAVSDASDSKGLALAALPLLTALALPEAAQAAVNPVASAFAAYGHYLGLVLVVASLTTEKFLVKPELTEDEAQKLVIADSVYGVAGVLVLYTGYLRVTQYGKGWEYYAHEPIFWVKMGLFAVMGSSSLFCTTKIVQMAVKKTNGEENATVLGEKLSAHAEDHQRRAAGDRLHPPRRRAHGARRGVRGEHAVAGGRRARRARLARSLRQVRQGGAHLDGRARQGEGRGVSAKTANATREKRELLYTTARS